MTFPACYATPKCDCAAALVLPVVHNGWRCTQSPILRPCRHRHQSDPAPEYDALRLLDTDVHASLPHPAPAARPATHLNQVCVSFQRSMRRSRRDSAVAWGAEGRSTRGRGVSECRRNAGLPLRPDAHRTGQHKSKEPLCNSDSCTCRAARASNKRAAESAACLHHRVYASCEYASTQLCKG